MYFPYTFKIRIYQRSFRGDTEDLEKLEDDLARLFSLYNFTGEIIDTVTGNETTFPFEPDDEPAPGFVEYKY